MIKYSGMSYLNVNFTIATLTKIGVVLKLKYYFISILQKHFNKVFLAFTFNEFHFREASVTYNQLRLSIGILKMKSLCLTCTIYRFLSSVESLELSIKLPVFC